MLEGIVLGAVAVDDFMVAAALFGPQAVGGGLAAEEKAGEQQGKSTHRESP
jgi:hypothetical protein